MPSDLSIFVESLQRALGEIPPVAVGLALLAGPTAMLIGYRLISVARRMKTSSEVEAAPMWVCQDCRSVNELRLSRCYRCGAERDATAEIEVIIDQPSTSPATFEAPAGSPFAAFGASTDRSSGHGPGRSVMADPSLARAGIAVGPGRPVERAAHTMLADDDQFPSTAPTLEAGGAAPGSDLTSAVKRHR